VRIPEKVNIDAKLALFSEHWAPKLIATLNDYEIKVVKIKGEFVWHQHTDTDELFLVLDGQLTIQLRDRDVVLGPRELLVVPRGVEHRPVAESEATVLLIEPAGVVNTGDDAAGPMTAAVESLIEDPVGT
jgi:mannose-6-phosphate isomerase-like protein (cupin superfamily)